MDEQVTAAMAKWPDVPAVYGWLSLTESGQWRLHPAGDALQQPGSPGEPITSPQILAFIDRNYGADEQGQWYFQNGPQRVYLRLDAAPFIAHTALDSTTGRLKLRTHTGLDIRRVTTLYLDEHGRVYVATDRGAALVAGRDLPALLDAFPVTDIEQALARCSEHGATLMLAAPGIEGFPAGPIPLQFASHASLESALGFCRHPSPSHPT